MTDNRPEPIIAKFQSLGDDATAKHSQRFFKTGIGEYGEGDVFLGVRVPVIRQQVKTHKDMELKTISELIKSEFHEIRLFAALMLVKKYQTADHDTQRRSYDLYLKNLKHINNWDIVDSSAHYIVGDYLFENNNDIEILYSLARNKNLWKRRVAIMSSFYFIKNKQYAHTLSLAEILLHDKEDLIHKAVGWMLREIGNRSINTEETFLKVHYQNMPRTMLRYAIEKFPEPKRKAYLKGKI